MNHPAEPAPHPPTAAPPHDRLQRLLLPVADAVMALMWSRPGGLSLRDTRVTRVTIVLALGVALVGLPAGALLLAGADDPPPRLLGLACVPVALGSLCLAVFGLRQRPPG
jgi:hypothetical protein